jgi:FkbM family methyltransferase
MLWFFPRNPKILPACMNRTSAGFLPVTRTGEQHALRAVLGGRPSGTKVVVLDCGANFGDYSEMVVREARKLELTPVVHAFEPASHAYQQLLRNPPTAHGEVIIHNLAVGAKSGTDTIHFPWEGAGGASLSSEVSALQGTARFGDHSEEIKVTTVDEFCLSHGIERVDLLKLDIEGSEFNALLGARRMLQSNAIRAIQFELGAATLEFGKMLYDFWKLLSNQFDFYLVLGNGLLHVRDYRPDLECFYGASNFLLVSRQ